MTNQSPIADDLQAPRLLAMEAREAVFVKALEQIAAMDSETWIGHAKLVAKAALSNRSAKP